MKKNSKKQLAQEHHPDAIKQRLQETPKSQYISDAVLGGIDGCITTFAVVSGVVGAGLPSVVAVVLGFANLIADGFSMAVSNYESNQAQKEFTDSLRKVEEHHIAEVPEGEREEIRQIYQAKGFNGDVLEQIVDTICKDEKLWIDTMLTEEYGVHTTIPNPWKSAGTTFVAFVLVGAMPLFPFLFSQLSVSQQFILSAILAGVMFFMIGMLKSLVFNKPVFLAGFRTLLTGGTAAGLAFLTGYLLREVFGIAGL